MSSASRGPTLLALSDGSVFHGRRLGAETESVGLVVFNTSMTGYEEMLTDPSYGGQILVPTYPLIGNYGINLKDAESKQIQVKGFVVRDDCDAPSHPHSEMTIHEYLEIKRYSGGFRGRHTGDHASHPLGRCDDGGDRARRRSRGGHRGVGSGAMVRGPELGRRGCDRRGIRLARRR